VAVALVAGCGGGDDDDTRVRGDTLTVYAGAPAHGTWAAAGDAALDGARRALSDAGGRAAGRRVRLVALPSTRPGDDNWDPGTVEAGAERAVEDPTAIAYLGEVDRGASAVSLPVTNRAGLVQVSPTDGLTSLTVAPPGRPRAGPARYYPEEKRTFERVVRPDLPVARGMLSRVPRAAARRVAVVHTEGFAERELAGILAFRLRRARRPALLVEPLRDDPDAPRALVDELVAKRPGAILLSAQRGGPSRALLRALAARLPAVPVIAGPELADGRAPGTVPGRAEAVTALLPGRLQPPRGRKLLRSLGTQDPHALYGYEAMTLVLRAIETAGPDRARVIAAAVRAPHRAGVVRESGLALVELGAGTHPPAVLLRQAAPSN